MSAKARKRLNAVMRKRLANERAAKHAARSIPPALRMDTPRTRTSSAGAVLIFGSLLGLRWLEKTMRMKPVRVLLMTILLAAACVLCALALPGCQDGAAVQADKASIASLQQQIATATTRPSATTQPLPALQAQLAAMQGQLAADEAAQKQSNLQTAAQVTAAAGTAASAAPPPWGLIIAGVLGITSTVLGVFATKQTSKLDTAQNVIAAAAPGVAHLVGQVTDSAALPTDITTLGQISSGVLSLLNHPAAVAAVNAVTPAVPPVQVPPVVPAKVS